MFVAMNAIRSPSAPAGRAKSQMIGHIFLEDDGTLSVSPTVKIYPDDEARLRAAVLKIGRWRSVTERLVSGRERGR
jgi:hypothetical protein